MSSTNKGAGGKAWAIVIFFTLFMVTMTFNLIVYPACAADTMRQYGISQAGLTTLSSVTSVVGLFAGFIFGPILDKRGSRKTILFGLLVGAVLFFVRVLVTSYALAIVLTFLASFFVGVCQVAASKVLATWFTPQTVSVAYSFQAAGAGFGSAGAFIIGAALGLKGSLLLIAIAYTVLFIYWLIAGKDGPIAVQGAQPPKGSSAMVWKSRTLWLMAIAASCAVGSTLLINSYCINAFVGKGMNPGQAALIGTVLNLSLLVGGYLGTFLMSVIKRYNIVTLICFIGGRCRLSDELVLASGRRNMVLAGHRRTSDGRHCRTDHGQNRPHPSYRTVSRGGNRERRGCAGSHQGCHHLCIPHRDREHLRHKLQRDFHHLRGALRHRIRDRRSSGSGTGTEGEAAAGAGTKLTLTGICRRALQSALAPRRCRKNVVSARRIRQGHNKQTLFFNIYRI